jgi:hypothetical protein
MPPRCCTQPIPGLLIKSLLNREEQTLFLKAVQQYSTPWENRVFCSNPNCGEFIPPRLKVDPKHPFQVTCRSCQTKVCIMCKRDAHPLGHDCPSDTELEAVLKIGEASGWKRCYKCRNLVELTQGCSHMTCRCKAQVSGSTSLRRIPQRSRVTVLLASANDTIIRLPQPNPAEHSPASRT